MAECTDYNPKINSKAHFQLYTAKWGGDVIYSPKLPAPFPHTDFLPLEYVC